MNLHSPRVSIGLPIYNGQRFAAQAIESMLGQTFGDFELVISDNASTDATQDLCLAYAARDRRIRYHRNPENIGANRNFNRVAELARAPYFRWAAHDDLVAPKFLERCVEVLDADPSIVLCHTRTMQVDAEGKPLTEEARRWLMDNAPLNDPPRRLDSVRTARRFYDLLLRTRWCFEIFGVIRREPLLRTGLQGSFYGADKVVLASLSLMGRFHEVPEELFLRRCHSDQSTSIRSAAARAVWSNPKNRKRVVVPQIECLRGYVDAVKSTALFAPERLACTFVLGRYLLQLGKIGLLLNH